MKIIPIKNSRFQTFSDIKNYWKDASDAPHIETLLFLVDKIENLEDYVLQLTKDIDNLLGTEE